MTCVFEPHEKALSQSENSNAVPHNDHEALRCFYTQKKKFNSTSLHENVKYMPLNWKIALVKIHLYSL